MKAKIPSRQFGPGAHTVGSPPKYLRFPFPALFLLLTQLPHALPTLLPIPAQRLHLDY